MIEINKIYNEDCLETMRRMPDNFIDLTVTSPPYDNLRDYKGCDWSFDIFKAIAKELYRVTKDGGVVVWVVGDATINGSETGTSFKQALYLKEIGFNLHDTMIYLKPNFSFPSHNKYHQTFEYMFVLVKDKIKTFNPIKDKKNKRFGKQKTYSKRESDGSIRKEKRVVDINTFGQRYNVWEINTGYMKSTKDKIAYKHPAIFPEALARDHIISWSNDGDLVYDPFTGSGTVACESIKLNRNWIGSELSKEYCDIANKRIKIELSQMKLF
jgi:site-specific DNA-methyltransferase (adenine-specific)